jgi:hypothetical protein
MSIATRVILTLALVALFNLALLTGLVGTVEYLILVGVVLAGLAVIWVWLPRRVQTRRD